MEIKDKHCRRLSVLGGRARYCYAQALRAGRVRSADAWRIETKKWRRGMIGKDDFKFFFGGKLLSNSIFFALIAFPTQSL